MNDGVVVMRGLGKGCYKSRDGTRRLIWGERMIEDFTYCKSSSAIKYMEYSL
jgi:hypothetical protein